MRALSRRVAALSDELSREQGRSHSSDQVPSVGSLIGNDIEVNIRHLTRRIERLRKEALSIIRSDPQLTRRYEQQSRQRGSQRSAPCGFCPRFFSCPRTCNPTNGLRTPDWIRSRSSPEHRPNEVEFPKEVTNISELPCICLPWWPFDTLPNIKAFYENLLGRGKEKMQAIVAVMRKLLIAIWGMFKNDENFNPDKFYRIPA